jgi:hypothetical protein
MRPTTPILKLPFPVFDVARYAAMASKITAETKDSAPPNADVPERPDDAHNLANISTVKLSAPGDSEAQMNAYDAAANLISLSEQLNGNLNATLDKFF